MTFEFEFCPKCGNQMFAKDDEQDVNSKFDIILLCGACYHECKLQDTFTFVEQELIKFIKFPVNYRGGEI